MPTTHQFKTDDWVLSEFKLKQIKEMDKGRVTSVSDGYFSTGSSDLRDRTFPLTMRGKLISAEYERVYLDLHEKGRRLNLNYPDIVNWLVNDWVETMTHQEDDDAIKAGYARLEAFHKDVLAAVDRAKDTSVAGISLFR